MPVLSYQSNPLIMRNAFVQIATEMVTETELETDWQNDPEACRDYEEWLASLETPEAFEEYDAWVTEQERRSRRSRDRTAGRGMGASPNLVWHTPKNSTPIRFASREVLHEYQTFCSWSSWQAWRDDYRSRPAPQSRVKDAIPTIRPTKTQP